MSGRLPRYARFIVKGCAIEMIFFCLVLYIVSHTRLIVRHCEVNVWESLIDLVLLKFESLQQPSG
jgi:hypothetical protein